MTTDEKINLWLWDPKQFDRLVGFYKETTNLIRK